MAEDLDREAWQELGLILASALRRDGAITASALETIRAHQLRFAAQRPGSPDAMRARRVAELAAFLLSGAPAPDLPPLRLVDDEDPERT